MSEAESVTDFLFGKMRIDTSRISKKLIAGKILRDSVIKVTEAEGKLVFKK